MNNLARHGVIASSRAAGSTLKNGLVSYWALDEASGTRADSHTNALDLTDNNTVTQGVGNTYANAADFESTASEYLSHADDTLFSPSSISIAMWVKLESLPTQAIILSKDDSSGTGTNREYIIDYESGPNRFKFFGLYGAGSFSVVTANSFGAVSSGTWYFIVAIHDQGTGLKISVNGGTQDTTAFNQTLNNGTAPFSLGCIFNGATPVANAFYDGLQGPVSLYDRAITSAEITDLYNAGSGLTYAQL